jgi:hypothetical protein
MWPRWSVRAHLKLFFLARSLDRITIYFHHQKNHNIYEYAAAAFTRDEYEEYIKIAPTRCEKPLEWWETRRQEYPRFSQIAFYLLSISLISIECERVFSVAKRFVTENRNELKQDIIEIIIFFRTIYKRDKKKIKTKTRWKGHIYY